jgi:hypothetical protein
MIVSIEQSKYRIIAFTILISILLFPNIVLSFTAKPPEQCWTEGEKMCSPDNTAVWICKDSTWVTYKTCPTDTYCDVKTYECISPQPQFNWNYLWAFLAGLVVAFIFIKSLRQKRMKK